MHDSYALGGWCRVQDQNRRGHSAVSPGFTAAFRDPAVFIAASWSGARQDRGKKIEGKK
jgi:hypothetical protein